MGKYMQDTNENVSVDSLEQAREEERRIKAEKERKLEEHRQRVQALSEATYDIADAERAKAADQLQWTDFETRILAKVKEVITPAFQVSIEDRTSQL